MAAAFAAQTLRLDGISKAPIETPGARPNHRGAKWLAPLAPFVEPAFIKSAARASSRRSTRTKSATDPGTITGARQNNVPAATPQRPEYSLRREADVVQGIDNEIAIGFRQRRHAALNLRQRESGYCSRSAARLRRASCLAPASIRAGHRVRCTQIADGCSMSARSCHLAASA